MSTNFTYDEFVELVNSKADKIGGSPYTITLAQMLMSELKVKPTRKTSDDGKQFIYEINLGGTVYIVWTRVAKPTILSLKECPKDTPWENKNDNKKGVVEAGKCKLVLT